jgi:ribosomal protein L11 methylase PrmA
MTELARSFRDPAGVCCLLGKRVFRFLRTEAVAEFERFLGTSLARDFTTGGLLISTKRLSGEESAALRQSSDYGTLDEELLSGVVLEHERIWFPSYPYEWAPEMLWEAGRLTLELARKSLSEGYCLKDATPYNVLYQGNKPIFIDVLSFERRITCDPVWKPYAQFIRTFVLPLLCNAKWGTSLAGTFATRRDGLEPNEVYRLCSPLQRIRPPFLSLVSMPTWLTSKATNRGSDIFKSKLTTDPDKADFILESLFKRLSRALESVKPGTQKASGWSNYMSTHTYSTEALSSKERFVESVLNEFKPARVLDIGANTGHFSALAAKAGAQVVAVDSDPDCVGRIWCKARQSNLDLLPLVVDLARPTPALGWRNGESPSFLDRATGAFDCVLMLAVVHHLLITERVPLEEVIKLASELTTSLLIIEFVGPGDEMFKSLVRGRDELYAGITEALFEKVCLAHFDVVRSLALSGTHRKLYALRKKGAKKD